jgi:RNA polymerase sigma factor (TIGR02999 family)
MDEANLEVSLTEQLQRYSQGDARVAEVVLREVLPKLHEIAVRELRREHQIAPLSPTELIHEAWMRSLRKGGWQISSRQHFYAVASLAMRRVLVQFARNRLALKRGNKTFTESLDDLALNIPAEAADLESVVRIGLSMDQLEIEDSEAARIVDMHYFAGFTFEEIMKATGLTFRQVRHRWEKGCSWLRMRI